MVYKISPWGAKPLEAHCLNFNMRTFTNSRYLLSKCMFNLSHASMLKVQPLFHLKMAKSHVYCLCTLMAAK